MALTKRVVQAAGLAAGALGAVAVSAPDTRVGRATKGLVRRVMRDGRYVVSSAPGVAYRLAGRHPDPNVADDILADRVRSSIGGLEHRLDIPHVHVMVEDHVVLLHGDVAGEVDARAIEQAVMKVSGVRGVESHLHAGLILGDTRPSSGDTASHHASPALQRLLDAARHAGARQPHEAVHAVLCAFLDRVPVEERAHVFAHLPADVRSLAGPARRHGEHARVRSVAQLVAAASADGGLDPGHATGITSAIVTALRQLVPEEANDVAAVLPPELRDLWQAEAAR